MAAKGSTTETKATNSGEVTINNIFEGTLNPRNDLTKFTLMRGVTDFTTLQQFDLYETGYSFLVNLQIPIFLDKLVNVNDTYDALIAQYKHLIEYEFRGCQGIEDITAETNAITNGIDDLQVITKVKEQAGSTFTMNYYERSGSIIVKTHELFLRGIKDPRTQVKRYHGLISAPSLSFGAEDSESNKNQLDKGYHSEIFHYMLIVTDNTCLNVEKAYILASCQPNSAQTNIYNVTRGEINFSEIGVSMNGFPISGRLVTKKAQALLGWINDATCFDEMSFGYSILDTVNEQNYKDKFVKSPTISGDSIVDPFSGNAEAGKIDGINPTTSSGGGE